MKKPIILLNLSLPLNDDARNELLTQWPYTEIVEYMPQVDTDRRADVEVDRIWYEIHDLLKHRSRNVYAIILPGLSWLAVQLTLKWYGHYGLTPAILTMKNTGDLTPKWMPNDLLFAQPTKRIKRTQE